MKYWEIIADNLSKAGRSLGCVLWSPEFNSLSGCLPRLSIISPVFPPSSVTTSDNRDARLELVPGGRQFSGTRWRGCRVLLLSTLRTNRLRVGRLSRKVFLMFVCLLQ